jgi:hypothetical protein
MKIKGMVVAIWILIIMMTWFMIDNLHAHNYGMAAIDVIFVFLNLRTLNHY